MKEITITKYEANDGTQFDSLEDCKKYENENCNYFELIKKVPHCFSCHEDMFPSGGGDDYTVYFKCLNKEQSRIVLKWAELNDIDVEVSESQMIGNIIVLPDVWACCGTLDGIDKDYIYGSLIPLSMWIGHIARAVGFVQEDEWETE